MMLYFFHGQKPAHILLHMDVIICSFCYVIWEYLLTVKKRLDVAEGGKVADVRTWGNLQSTSLKKKVFFIV